MKLAIGSRIGSLKAKSRLKTVDFAKAAEVSPLTVTLWQSGKVMPTLTALTALKRCVSFDLNALVNMYRSADEISTRSADKLRMARVINNLSSAKNNPEVPMFTMTRALIIRAIMTCPEEIESSLFDILATHNRPTSFSGADWVRALYEGYAREVEARPRRDIDFSERVMRIRHRVGLTRNGFSAVLGIPQTTLLSWENGRAPQLLKFAATFGRLDIDLNWFVTEPIEYIAPFSNDVDWDSLLQ